MVRLSFLRNQLTSQAVHPTYIFAYKWRFNITNKEPVNAEAHQLLQRRCVTDEILDLIIHCHLFLAIEPFELSLDRIKCLESQLA